jgi:hypothetical protein
MTLYFKQKIYQLNFELRAVSFKLFKYETTKTR